MQKEDISLDLVFRSLKKLSIKAVHCGDPLLPDLLVVDEKTGLVSVFVFLEGNFQNTDDQTRLLKKRNKALSDEVSALLNRRVNLPLLVLQTPAKGEGRTFEIPLDIFSDITTKSYSELELRKVFERFNPIYVFEKRRRINFDDPFVDSRDNLRLSLDKSQRKIVDLEPNELLYLDGPPGSGKSLVLCARAMKMAQENPDWNIQFITYNKSLAKATRDQLSEFRNIQVKTFYEFISERKAKFSFYKKIAGEKVNVSKSKTEFEFLHAKKTGIPRDVDAIFIDEAQDFWPAWLKYCIDSQVSGRGGATIAGDKNQSLYIESELDEVMSLYESKLINLRYPYRNTVEILKITELLTGMKQEKEFVPNGLVPTVVYVDISTSRNNVNSAVIQDIEELLSQPGIRPGDIAILVSRHHMKYALRGQLQEALDIKFKGEIKVDSIQKGAGDLIDLRQNSIKIMTVHNAKGLTFPIVLLVGIDLLYEGDSGENFKDTEKRLLLVAPTRASDRLMMYVSQFPRYLQPLKDNPSCYQFRIYPEDYQII